MDNIYIDLDTIKKHLNLDQDFTDDDDYLYQLSEAALTAVENHIDTPLTYYVDDDGRLDSALVQAALLLIANFYENRESVAFAQAYRVPHGFEYLLNQYIRY